MAEKKKYSLRRKLIIAFSLISLLVAVFVVILLSAHMRAADRAAVLEAEHVAVAVAITGLDDAVSNPQFLERYVADLHQFYQRDVSMVDLEKRIVADADPKKNGSAYTGDRGNEIALTMKDGRTRTFVEVDPARPKPQKQVVVPMRQDESNKASPITGAVIFEYTQIHDQLTAEARSRIYPLALIGLAFVLVTGVAGIRFALALSKPVKVLQQGVVQLAREFDVSIDVAGTDEIETLSAAFSKMAERLRASHAQLIDEHHDLETRVAARTTELTETNIQLQGEIKERRRAQERLAFLARYDTLTKLPNRHMFHDRLAEVLKLAKMDGAYVGCLYVDLEGLKAVNEARGHSFGDLLLHECGARLKACVRDTDLVSRLGGHAFGVMLISLAERGDAGIVAAKIIGSLSAPFDLKGKETRINVSVGAAVHPDDGDDVESLLQHADFAMQEAKKRGPNACEYYEAAMHRDRERRLGLEAGLRTALERGELELCYQPKAELTGGTISGVEALLRWSTPEHDSVSPTEFIPMLEDAGLITRVGDWTLRTACAQIAAWRAEGLPPVPVALNVSMLQFLEPDFDVRVEEILLEHGVDPGLITFEILESLLTRDPERAAAVIPKLKALGLKLSIDDFGTGYASLSYLRQFPLDEIKIDRDFTQNITADLNNAAIILAIIKLAHDLRLRVVTEGVETEAQVMYLRTHGCDEIQGFYFAPPLPAHACTRMLREGTRLTWPAEDGPADTPRLLLVDDVPEDLELMQHALAPGGYRIQATSDARLALEMLMQHPYDIVVSDHNMPGMSGVDFLSAVRSLFPNVVRIVMSGVDSSSLVADALNVAGAHKFLSKNWDTGRLQAEVRDAHARFHR